MRQKGHTPVEYITILAMGSLLDRQARLLPRGEPTLQLVDVRETGLLQEPTGGPGARSALAGDDHRLRLELGDLVDALRELANGNVARARQVAGRIVGTVAHVE